MKKTIQIAVLLLAYCYIGCPASHAEYYNQGTNFNGDGKNDVLLPVIEPNCDIRHYTFQVFNRYGQRIFYSSDPDKGWDGKFNDMQVEIGTYMYEVSFENGMLKNKYYQKGDVTLIR